MKSQKIPPGLREAQRRAGKIIHKQKRLNAVLNEATAKLKKNRSRLQKIFGNLELLIRMAKAYHSGEYRRLPLKAIITIVGAIIYVINPFDMIPDFITGLGFFDDAAVVTYVMKTLQDEINLFRQYLNESGESIAGLESEDIGDSSPETLPPSS
jgi:uncharacterized membrane protein YkvA (DUF1232 family)